MSVEQVRRVRSSKRILIERRRERERRSDKGKWRREPESEKGSKREVREEEARERRTWPKRHGRRGIAAGIDIEAGQLADGTRHQSPRGA